MKYFYNSIVIIYYLIIQLHYIHSLQSAECKKNIIYVIRVRSIFKYANADLTTWNNY